MAVSYDLNKVFFEYPFLVPDYFALITRAMIVLEGIAVTGLNSICTNSTRNSGRSKRIRTKTSHSLSTWLFKTFFSFFHQETQNSICSPRLSLTLWGEPWDYSATIISQWSFRRPLSGWRRGISFESLLFRTVKLRLVKVNKPQSQFWSMKNPGVKIVYDENLFNLRYFYQKQIRLWIRRKKEYINFSWNQRF